MAKSCKGLALELAKCLTDSPCVKDEKRSVKDCAHEKPPLVSSTCVGLRETYFMCKRGQVDMTKRIKGNLEYIRLRYHSRAASFSSHSQHLSSKGFAVASSSVIHRKPAEEDLFGWPLLSSSSSHSQHVSSASRFAKTSSSASHLRKLPVERVFGGVLGWPSLWSSSICFR